MTETMGNKLLMDIGRIIGVGKKKEPDIVEQWRSLMEGKQVNATDRILEYMKVDLMNNGADVDAMKKDTQLSKNVDRNNRVMEFSSAAQSIEALGAQLIQEKQNKIEQINKILERAEQDIAFRAANLNALKERLELIDQDVRAKARGKGTP